MNNHGLRYEIPIDPDGLSWGNSGLPDLTFTEDRQPASLSIMKFLFMLRLRKWTYKKFKYVLAE